MTTKANWNYPTPIRFGAGRITELAEACQELGITRPLLVTDPGLAQMPMVAEAAAITEAAGLPTRVFSDVRPNPVEKNVTDGVADYRAGGCDGVIAMGGGSALDVAKAVALMVGQDRPLFDFEDVGDNWTRADAARIAPIVGVPTTSGTGSEVGRCSVITDEADQVKKLVFHPKLMPSMVILDPALTVGMPPTLTAGVGMDALGHNLEAYLAPGYHPMADGIALQGMRLIHQNLERAVAAGDDLDARANMMVASTMGATAFQKGLGAIHAMSHPVSAELDVHHGTAISTFMPYVLAKNLSSVSEKVAHLGRCLGLSGSPVQWVVKLRSAIGMPHTAAELGVNEDMIPGFAEKAMLDPTMPTNPVTLTREEVERLYVDAMEGRLP